MPVFDRPFTLQVVPLLEAPIPDHYVDDGQGNQPTDNVKGVDPGHGEEERVTKPVLGGPKALPDPSLHPLYDLAIR